MGNEQSTLLPARAAGMEAPDTRVALTEEQRAARILERVEELEQRRLKNVARKKAEREAAAAAEKQAAVNEARTIAQNNEARKIAQDNEAASKSPQATDGSKAELQARYAAAQLQIAERRRGLAASLGPPPGAPKGPAAMDRNRETNSTVKSVVRNEREDPRTTSRGLAPKQSPALQSGSNVRSTPASTLPDRGHNDGLSFSPRRESNDSGIGMSRNETDQVRAIIIPTGPRRKSSGNDRAITDTSRHVYIEDDKGLASASTGLHGGKRQAASTQTRDAPKRPRTSNSPSTPPLPRPEEEDTETGDRQPPAWYRALTIVPKRRENDAAVEPLLRKLKSKITLCKDPRNHLAQQQTYNEIRHSLHELMFQKVDERLLRNNSMLHNDRGLPQLFDERYSGGVPWPFDIKADARELYSKWCNRVFETDLLRGIIPGGGKSADRSSDKLDENWPYRISPARPGNNRLVNGQWWPTQLAALRDGAHGSSQAGIYGQLGQGALSCIMAGNHDYTVGDDGDKDEGEVVYYCGTDSNDGAITPGTKHMIESCASEQAVRLIRSHKVQSKYAPEMGLRYDGLYDVVNYERLDPESSLRQRYRFKLVRQAGQDPIRGNGPEKRPTQQEMEAHQKDKRLRGVGGGAIKGKKGTVHPTWS